MYIKKLAWPALREQTHQAEGSGALCYFLGRLFSFKGFVKYYHIV